MDNYSGNKEYNIYRDIRNRTNGEIYLGIVGPVRTGKSTFIKRFMELMVLPFMEGEAEKERAMDELPQAAAGKNHYDDGTKSSFHSRRRRSGSLILRRKKSH